jgi:ABC-2 type transport system permease protein
MIAAIRSEWIKLTTITVTWLLAIAALAFPLIVSFLTALFADEVTGETLAGVVSGTTVVSGMLLGVIASVSITSEFGNQTIRPTFAAMPDRWRPLLAKPIVQCGLAAALTTVVVLVGWFGGRVIAGDDASRDLEGTGAALLGVVLLSIGLTLLGYGLGLLMRNTAAAICVLLLWPLIAEGLVAGLLSAAGAESAAKWLPYSAGISMAIVDVGDEDTLGRVGGGLWFFAWVLVIFVLGLLSAKRRDA